ncbi:Rha family transcriptional regulator [Deinococcus arenicola]|uniref:Rha family transcriptional regulator n=1 Tax=Deinococcus arenicola TaxID=2994950 RepID=A0ABU4DVI0_9DEIO|nr:Rha family transcriptional regulator [Deinococcus sp. ZS9-10]MDV6376456.1 Rha family transcriptional regulator [Deinococcus sp. ZS9-10]
MEIVAVPNTQGEIRLDSRALAERMGNEHASVMKLIQENRTHFEGFGILGFEIEEIKGRGQPAKFAQLNEDQCYFLLTLVRNSETTVPMKAAVVAAFAKARQIIGATDHIGGGDKLISARQIGIGLGIKPKHAAIKASRAGILPTHHFFESRCNAPAYLFPLDEVQAYWPRFSFPAFQGQPLPGIGPVSSVVKAINDTKIAHKHQPRLIPTDTLTEQLARRLLSLEAQKREVLRQLAVAS